MSLVIQCTQKQYTNKNDKFILNVPLLKIQHSQLVGIYGKSGCGKSTLLNLIGLIDKPDKGSIIFDRTNISKLSIKKQERFRNSEIGFVFQHYNLLEDYSALYNVMLPMLISGIKKKEAYHKAEQLLLSINFPRNLYKKKCSNLSGGEKQRVAFLRALANDPSILLADEPTGALDSQNAKVIMELLKKHSENKIVIVVSHDLHLLENYCDRLIELQEGSIVSDKIIREGKHVKVFNQNKKVKPSLKWSNDIISHNIKKRFKRNVVSISALFFGLIFSMMIIGFHNGYEASIDKLGNKQFDFGSLTLCKESKYSLNNSALTITRQSKLSNEEIIGLSDELQNYYIEPNFDALVSQNSPITYEQNSLEGVSYCPIYSFEGPCINKDLLYEGRLPSKDNINECVINISFYNDFINKYNTNPIGKTINIISKYTYQFEDQNSAISSEYFIYNQDILITGVVDELSFLSSNKIYYSYVSLETYLLNEKMYTYSKFKGTDYSWYDVVYNSFGVEQIGSYSHRLFLKDYSNFDSIKNDLTKTHNEYAIKSNGYTIKQSLFDLTEACSSGLDIFMLVSWTGTFLILGIVSFSSYCEDRKKSAIISCLGCSRSEIIDIYATENLFIGLASLFASMAVFPLFSLVLNKIIENYTGLSNVIKFPYKEIKGIPFLLPLIIFMVVIIISTLSAYIPISFSKKITIKEELRDE